METPKQPANLLEIQAGLLLMCYFRELMAITNLKEVTMSKLSSNYPVLKYIDNYFWALNHVYELNEEIEVSLDVVNKLIAPKEAF